MVDFTSSSTISVGEAMVELASSRAMTCAPRAVAMPRVTDMVPTASLVRLAGAAGVPVPVVAFELPEGSPAGDGYAMASVAGEPVGSRVLPHRVG